MMWRERREERDGSSRDLKYKYFFSGEQGELRTRVSEAQTHRTAGAAHVLGTLGWQERAARLLWRCGKTRVWVGTCLLCLQQPGRGVWGKEKGEGGRHEWK